MRLWKALGVLVIGFWAFGCANSMGQTTLPATSVKPGLNNFEIKSGGLTREYLLFVPKAYDGRKPFPLIMAFHGGGGNAEKQMETSQLNSFAEKQGIVVAYPNGTGRLGFLTWNSGKCCGYAVKNEVDDVGFTRAMLAKIKSDVVIDNKRVYATGISNGAMMAYRLACEMSEELAAIAPVAGTLAVDSCSPKKLVPIIHFHGTADQNVPLKGGMGEDSVAGVSHRSVYETLDIMKKMRGCDNAPGKTKLGDSTVDKYSCRNGGPVEFVLIDNGGHNWPGGDLPNRAKRRGEYTSQSISANEEMWTFFNSLSGQ